MIAVSLWDSAEHAAAMGQLREMQTMRQAFKTAGLNFQPIKTYEEPWHLERAD